MAITRVVRPGPAAAVNAPDVPAIRVAATVHVRQVIQRTVHTARELVPLVMFPFPRVAPLAAAPVERLAARLFLAQVARGLAVHAVAVVVARVLRGIIIHPVVALRVPGSAILVHKPVHIVAILTQHAHRDFHALIMLILVPTAVSHALAIIPGVPVVLAAVAVARGAPAGAVVAAALAHALKGPNIVIARPATYREHLRSAELIIILAEQAIVRQHHVPRVIIIRPVLVQHALA